MDARSTKFFFVERQSFKDETKTTKKNIHNILVKSGCDIHVNANGDMQSVIFYWLIFFPFFFFFFLLFRSEKKCLLFSEFSRFFGYWSFALVYFGFLWGFRDEHHVWVL